MKSLIKFFFLPFVALVVLNIILVFYVNDFQNRTAKNLLVTTTAHEYLGSLSEAEAKLDRFLISRQPADSIDYLIALRNIEEQTDTIADLYPNSKSLIDSLKISSQLYINDLKELEETVLATGLLSETELIALTLKAENGHRRVDNLITDLNKINDLSIISSLSEARVYTRYVFILLFLLIFIIFIVAYRQFLAPLHRLRKEIRKLSEGSYSQIEIERDDEVGELINAFNDTIRTLRLSEQKLKKVNQELATTNKELEAFAYSVSHDLRSPLRSISGFSDALVNNYASELSETAQDYLNRVHKAAIKMGELIDEILKLSRISSREIKRDTIDITELTHEIIELTKTDDEKHISFKVDNHLTLHGDAGLTKILLLNLLSNAIKFSKTKEHPVIKVGSVIKNGKPFIFVKDNGVGFDMKYADKIFGVFQRLHTNDAFKGTGIGLATVKRIINKHGGNIYFESEEGKGTTVYFNLEK